MCGAEITRPAAGGRPAKYCSGACRQRAFRQRTATRRADEFVPCAEPLFPALDRFVGRTRTLPRLRELLASTRLLTLVGPGGVGKTRLAVELARHARDRPVHLVELDSAHDESMLLQVVAETLGVDEHASRPGGETLTDSIGDRELLVVLDNCEHLAGSCAKLAAQLLMRCPGVRILATSREALGVPDEVAFRVTTLSVPKADPEPDRAAALRSDAVRLFLDRARACDPAFELTNDNAAIMAEICRRLDGLPLAIELAARRVGALPLPEILAGLDDQLVLLTEGSRTGPDRHRELRAAIEWSHQLLAPAEQAVFRRLSVLAGGFDREAATAVCHGAGSAGVWRSVTALEAKSLVVPTRGALGRKRFRQLHSIRAYGAERLAAAGELGHIRDLAAAWLARLAEPVPRTVCLRAGTLCRLREERDNLVAAVEFTAAQADDRHVLLAVALALVWQERPAAGRQLLADVLAKVPHSAFRSDALTTAAVLAARQRDLGEALGFAEQALRIERQQDRPIGLAKALDALAFVRLCQSETDLAIAAQRECVDIVSRSGPPLDVAYAKNNLAWQLLQTGEEDEAGRLLADSLPHLHDAETPARVLAAARHTAGIFQLRKGNIDAAEAGFAGGLRRIPPDSLDGAPLLEGLAIVAGARGEALRALCLAAAAQATRRRLGVVATREWREYVLNALEDARHHLGRQPARAALAAARQLRGERLMSYALRGSDELPHPGGQEALLTGQELRLTHLVAEGATNQEIARRLGLSVGTVKARLAHILGKLGLHSRTQLAVWTVAPHRQP